MGPDPVIAVLISTIPKLQLGYSFIGPLTPRAPSIFSMTCVCVCMAKMTMLAGYAWRGIVLYNSCIYAMLACSVVVTSSVLIVDFLERVGYLMPTRSISMSICFYLSYRSLQRSCPVISS